MNPIQFTPEHKTKLLEMCSKLFPKNKIEMYYDTDVADSWEEAYNIDTCGNDAQVQFIIFNWHKPNVKMYHWFEFCMTHLINTLAWENITSEILADCQYENARLKYLLELAKDRPDPGQFHPVDYLYEEFKKLKL